MRNFSYFETGDLANTGGAHRMLCAHQSHTAHFYSSDTLLMNEIGQRLASRLVAGGAGLIIATPAHRRGIEQQLTGRGFDLQTLASQGRWVALDAIQMMAELMVDGWPDETRFSLRIGSVMDRLAAATVQTAHSETPQIGAFCEMVALLSEQGKPAAAIGIEQFWNNLSRTRRFHLSCGWPLRLFSNDMDSVAVQRICCEHTHVIPKPVINETVENERRRGGVLWQLKAQALLQRASHIARQTLGYYKDAPAPQPVSVSQAFEDVLAIYDSRLRLKEISVRKHLRPGLKVCMPVGDFKQIVSGLVSNAIDASFQGNQVYVAAWPSQHPATGAHGIRLTVGDQGIGIPPSASRNVFTPFLSASKDINIGLGLWTVCDLLEKKGGSIRFRSRMAAPGARNSGTLMMAFLPTEAVPPEEKVSAPKDALAKEKPATREGSEAA